MSLHIGTRLFPRTIEGQFVANLLNSVPPIVIARFGHRRAKPRVVSVYDPKQGWTDDHRRRVVTWQLVEELRAAGFTLVEAKWRRTMRQLNLFLIPDPDDFPTRRSNASSR